MKIEILHEAEEELAAAISYYEGIEPGLGVRLKQEARQCIRCIGKNPTVRQLIRIACAGIPASRWV
jgi:hypothetical protein